jgi:hypothetical protein
VHLHLCRLFQNLLHFQPGVRHFWRSICLLVSGAGLPAEWLIFAETLLTISEVNLDAFFFGGGGIEARVH